MKEDRELFGSITDGTEKLEQLLRIHEKIDHPTKLTGSARFFYNTTKSIVSCFQNHFQSDKDRFIEKWGDFKHSTFANVCCEGSDICGNIKVSSKKQKSK